MFFKIYDSRKDDKYEFIKHVQGLIGEMCLCIYENKVLKEIKRTFLEFYTELENRCEHIIAKRCGNDLLINNFLIRRTTELGKSIFDAWWIGSSYELSVYGSFEFDSPLSETLYHH